ncbi:MAG: hypothetical protein AB1325_13475 [Nitrospirota bacterium]
MDIEEVTEKLARRLTDVVLKEKGKFDIEDILIKIEGDIKQIKIMLAVATGLTICIFFMVMKSLLAI